jgi:methylenetetrahydrofolate reductase (NADH)
MVSKAASALLVKMLEAAQYEVLPTPNIFDQVIQHVPTERPLTVTASPAKGLEATLDLAVRLATNGYRVTPHVAARMVSGRDELVDVSQRLVDAGIRSIFVPAGDQTPPAGDYTSAVDLLEDLEGIGRPFAEVGITGYPDTHPKISDDITIQSMWEKRRHATYLVSDLNFDAKAVAAWVARLRLRGIVLPVILGVPGPVDRVKLLSIATKIGVGDSTRFLTKHKSTFARLAAPGGYTGESFLQGTARYLASPESLVRGIHVYTFNQVAESERWRSDFLGRLTARR